MSTTTARNKSVSLASSSPADLPLDQLPVVELSDQQLTEAERLAKRRARSYKGINGGRVYGDLSSVRAHKTGVVGELVVADCYGGSIDGSQYETGDQGFDVDWAGGHKVDVKTTKTQALDRPDLLVPPDPEPTADLFILVHWFADRRARVVGWSTLSRVTREEPKRYPGESLNYVVPASDLLLPPEPTQSAGVDG